MERKNITIREDQAEWIEETGVNLSQLVQDSIDDRMGPTKEDLAEAYRSNSEHASETNEAWADVSTEADEQLGANPADE